ncbi:hypothetical protein EDC04DRAFT_2610645 [Pisolithus marmoratus]|nr:hypothetical protein EDC04DRAFT_2610645 [Pisolithus marmoratus]
MTFPIHLNVKHILDQWPYFVVHRGNLGLTLHPGTSPKGWQGSIPMIKVNYMMGWGWFWAITSWHTAYIGSWDVAWVSSSDAACVGDWDAACPSRLQSSHELKAHDKKGENTQTGRQNVDWSVVLRAST